TFFVLHPPAPPPLSTLSLHDALPISYFPHTITAAPYTSAAHGSFLTGKWPLRHGVFELFNRKLRSATLFDHARRLGYRTALKVRSEEHTSELQSLAYLVCRLLLEKKK